MVGKKKRNNHG